MYYTYYYYYYYYHTTPYTLYHTPYIGNDILNATQVVLNHTKAFFLHGILPPAGLDELDEFLLKKIGVYMCMYVCVFVCMYVCRYICLYVYVCICVRVCMI